MKFYYLSLLFILSPLHFLHAAGTCTVSVKCIDKKSKIVTKASCTAVINGASDTSSAELGFLAACGVSDDKRTVYCNTVTASSSDAPFSDGACCTKEGQAVSFRQYRFGTDRVSQLCDHVS